MSQNTHTISACLVVYNEEDLIERCLSSIHNVVDEIIVIHDGACKDKTLEIAKKYGARIFEEDHIGIAEPHRSKSYELATSEWIFQIDADEYIDSADGEAIRALAKEDAIHGYWFLWELWDGKQPVRFPGLQKLALFRKSVTTYQGIPQTAPTVQEPIQQVPILLHHKPRYSNVSWSTANKKRAYWLASHIPYFFPDEVTYQCFATDASSWIKVTQDVQQHPYRYMLWHPLKNLIGQLKNGLYRSYTGWHIALQQYVYYLVLYREVHKKHKKKKQK